MTQPTHKCCSYKNCRVGGDIPQLIETEFKGKRGETKWCRTCREHFNLPARLARRQAKIVEYGGHKPQPVQPAPNQRWVTFEELLLISHILFPDNSGGLHVLGDGKRPVVKDRGDLGPGEVNFCVV